MNNKKGAKMIKFDKNDVQLLNDLWGFLSASDDIYLLNDAFSMSSKKALKGWLVYESEGNDDRYFNDLEIFEKAFYIKKGVKK